MGIRARPPVHYGVGSALKAGCKRQPMHISVTGGTGVLGGTVFPELLADGHSVRAQAHNDAAGYRLPELAPSRCPAVWADGPAMELASRRCRWCR
jgi:hypothetical protein